MAVALWSVLAVATLAPLIAGLLPLAGRSLSERWLHALLGTTAGLLLGVAFLDLLPEAFAEGGSTVGFTLGASFLALYLVEAVMGVHGHGAHEHGAHEEGDHFQREVRYPVIALAALAVHTLVDGLVLPSAFAAGTAAGIAAGIGIAAHKFPDGFAAGTILVGHGAQRRTVIAGVLVIALLTPLGALIGSPLSEEPTWLPHLLAVAAGTFIFVAAAELLPELHHGPHKRLVTGATFVGFAVAFAIGEVVHRLGIGHG